VLGYYFKTKKGVILGSTIDESGIIQEIVIGGPMAEALLRVRAERLLDGELK